MHLDDDQGRQEPSDKADVVIQANLRRKWQSYVWDTLDKSPEERRFLFKLDAALLTFASLGIEPDIFMDMEADHHRLFHQVFGPGQYQQCFCVWNVSNGAQRRLPGHAY